MHSIFLNSLTIQLESRLAPLHSAKGDLLMDFPILVLCHEYIHYFVL